MKKIFKNIGMYIGIQGLVGVLIGIPLVYGGFFLNIKENWVLTAQTTMNHKDLAKLLATDEEIKLIIEKHSIKDTSRGINEGEFRVFKYDVNQAIDSTSTYAYPGSEIIYNEDGIRVDTFREGKFKAYVAVIEDPSRVKVATTENLGSMGEKLEHMTQRYDAVIGINAGGFVDENGRGTGGTPLGVVIEDGAVIYGKDNKESHIVGFDKDNKLKLSYLSKTEAINNGYRDAITFRPFLIVDGIPQITEGNGGWGIAPRTAIGQRKDGAVIMLVIDGRQTSSVGATLKEVQDIMLLYGAYNCTNLDGGSSSQLVLNNTTINKPSSSHGPRNLSTAFIVTKEN